MKHLHTFESFANLRLPSTPEDDAKQYFDESALRSATEHENTLLCHMPIDDFLAVCNKGYSEKKHAITYYLVNSGIKFNEIPFLCFTHDNNGNATVVGHEGRHRAKVLKSFGVNTMPVLMKNYSGGEGSYLINKQNMLEQPECFDEEFPRVLKGELENGQNKVPFPITL